MNTAALLIAVLLAADPVADGGVLAPALTIESLYQACPDAPLAEIVDGGYFVPEGRARRQLCQQAACEAYAAPKLAEESGPPTSAGTVFILAGSGAALMVIGIVIGFLLPHPAPAPAK